MDKKASYGRRELARSLYLKGMKPKMIKEKLGMSRTWVHKACREISSSFDLIPVGKRRSHPRAIFASRTLGITREDFLRFGVTGAKAKAKRSFRRKILALGLERKDDARILIDAYKAIQRVRYPPITPDNCNVLLEVMKGFMTTREVDYGLNGPA